MTTTQTISQASYQFPTREEFWKNRPPEITTFDWLFHPLNPHRFESPSLIAKLLNRIRRYSNLKGFTFFFQATVASWLGISVKWLRELLRRLKIIGWIEDRKIRKNRQLRVVEFNPNSLESSLEPSFISTASSSMPEASEPENQSYSGYRSNRESNSISSIISQDDRDKDIISTFEEVTETKFNPKRDNASLKEIRQLPLQAIIIGIKMSQVRIGKNKINSLKYCIPAIRELIKVCSIKVFNRIDTRLWEYELPEGSLIEYGRYVEGKLRKLRLQT